jgi:HEAT repeat protein
MGTEARRTSIKKVRPMRLLGVLLAILLPFLISTYCFSDSDQPPDYFDEWLRTLRKGNAKEKNFALLGTPSFLDCCQYKKNPEVFDLILKALEDKDPSIREAAAACLAQRIDRYSMKCCQETEIVPSLIKTLGDGNSRVREEAAKALAFYKDERAVDGLIERLRDKDPWVKVSAVFALGQIGATKAVDPLLKLLEGDSEWRNKFVQQESLIAIRKIGEFQVAVGMGGQTHKVTPGGVRTEESKQPRETKKIGGLDEQTVAKIVPVLIEKSGDPYLRHEVIKALVQFQAVEAKDILFNSANDSDEGIRKLALGALSWLPESEELKFEILRRSLKDPSISVRALAVSVIGNMKDPRVVDSLTESLRDSDQTVQLNAIKGLADFKDEKILDDITSFLGSDRLDMHQAAVNAFMSIARNSTKEHVFVYREEGRVAKTSERLIHPRAVGNLLDLINRSDEKGKLAALDLVSQFEDKRIGEVLLKLLDDPSLQVRRRALYLVPYFLDNTVIPRLILASEDKDWSVRAASVRALGKFNDKRRLEPLIKRLEDIHPEVRVAALDSLTKDDDPRLSDGAIRLLNDNSVLVRRAAASNVMERKDKRAIEALIVLLNDTDSIVASRSVEALGIIGDNRVVTPLIKASKGGFNKSRMSREDMNLRKIAIKWLGLIGDPEAIPALLSALEERELRYEAMVALGSFKDQRAVEALIKCLSDKSPYIRGLAVAELRKIGDPAGLEAIKNIPEGKIVPPVGRSMTPIQPTLPSFIPKEQLPGSGYSVTMFPKQERKEEKPSPLKEEKPEAIPNPPPARIVSQYDIKPRPSADIKPLLSKLKVNDPKIRREAADKLGDIGNNEATDHLIPLLKDKDEYVRQAAARALGKLRDKKAVVPLIAGLKDPEVNVRAFSVWALGEIQDTRAIEPLCNSLFDKEQKVKGQSFEALRKFREPASRRIMVNTLIKGAKIESSASWTLRKLISLEGREVILRAIEDPEGDKTKTIRNYIDLMEADIQNVSNIAVKALEDYPDRGMVISELLNYIGTQPGTPIQSLSMLGRFKDRRVLPILLDALDKRKDPFYRSKVVNAMSDLGDKEAVEPLLQILVDDKEIPEIRIVAARALGKFGDTRAVEPLLGILRDERASKEVRREATSALGTFKDKRTVEPLINILKNRDEDIWLRVAAASSLGDIGDEKAISSLQETLKDPSDYVRHAAQGALQKMKTK